MSSREGSKKGRGRPRKDSSEADTSLKTQREKNRYAQTVFRARKRAAEVASEQRISLLEGTIERMGDAFLTLVDHVIQSNRERNDPELNGRLHSSMQTFLTLAAAPSDSNSDRSVTGNQGDILPPTPYVDWNLGNDGAPGPSRDWEGAGLSQDASISQSRITNDSINTWNFLKQFNSMDELFPGLTGSPVNVLGNGWTGDIPFPYTASLDQNVRPPAAQSISTLIIQATLYYVYYILLEANNASPSDIASNIFRYALKLHSRDELLFNLRWFLGPGRGEAYRLGKTGFQILNHQGYDDVPTLSPSIDSDALNDVRAQKTHNSSIHHTLINADGVEAYLIHHGVQRISQDVLEVDLEQTLSADEAQRRSGQTAQSDMFNLNIFFPDASEGSRGTATSTQRTSVTRTVRFSQTSFLRFLVTQASHCLAYGPGYRRDRLHDLIEAAAIPT